MPATIDVAISQFTTARWGLAEELTCLREHGVSALSIRRQKLSDEGVEETRAALERAAVRCSSLQSAGGFTGGDGRTYCESLEDAFEALDEAARLGAPVLVVHSGCRGGHTRTHALRLLGDALASLAPRAAAEGVTLALRPMHPAAACGCTFLTDLAEALDLVEALGSPSVGLALDLWQFGTAEEVEPILPQLAAATAIVQVADRREFPTLETDRLPPGQGGLPLEPLVAGLLHHGYRGVFEFDPVGEAVEIRGYAPTVADLRRLADAWSLRAATGVHRCPTERAVPVSGIGTDALSGRPLSRPHHLRAGAGSRRSQASSQAVSRG
jgi:sugar phosphate isomerase/epimerase